MNATAPRRALKCGILLFFLVAGSFPGLPAAAALSELPRNDNVMVAVDLESGKVLWTNATLRLGEDSLQLYEAGLVVSRPTAGSNIDLCLLDPQTGLPAAYRVAKGSALSASSDSFKEGQAQVDCEGWALKRQTGAAAAREPLVFTQPGRPPWGLPAAGDPGEVRCAPGGVLVGWFTWRGGANIAYYQTARSNPEWRFDFKFLWRPRRNYDAFAFVPTPREVLVDAGGVLCGVDLQGGRLNWLVDYAAHFRMTRQFETEDPHSMILTSGTQAVVAGQRIVVGLDTARRTIPWALYPGDVFPTCCLHAGKLYMIVGKKFHPVALANFP
jgi:hypothetical protein